ncbi:uncharacterized protein LOC128302838 [Anopheles moucheti]|uniref:uncharacterized protein LOC128302838 n=1 Tax=Anopheles moucheti TaxID=186751 RepID=UPI0022F02AC3|nr:uncharacterized protein LOC128302838 [Anopheles moucheti]
MATSKALRVVGVVTSVMRNHSGPQVAKRRLMAAVAESIIRYAAPVWSGATRFQWCRRKLAQVQKPLARGVTSSFISVAYKTGVVLAGLLPYRLLILEDARCHRRLLAAPGTSRKEVRASERLVSMQEWQRSWDLAAEAPTASRYVEWAHRMIPDLHQWVGRRHGEVDFHLSQILTGHGFFREYLHVRGFAPTPECPRCPGSVESVAHVLFQCEVFAEIREEFLGFGSDDPVHADNLGMKLLESLDQWNSIQEAARRITKVLQEIWREDEVLLNTRAPSSEIVGEGEDEAASPAQLGANRVRTARRRQSQRAAARADIRLAAAVAEAERAREDEVLRTAAEAEAAGTAPPPIPRRNRGRPPSPGTIRQRYDRRIFMQRAWRERMRSGTIPPVPPGQSRRNRAPPSEADVIRRRRRRREMDQARRAAARGAILSNQGLREPLSEEDVASITEATTSGR